jgi:hypothetical protein
MRFEVLMAGKVSSLMFWVVFYCGLSALRECTSTVHYHGYGEVVGKFLSIQAHCMGFEVLIAVKMSMLLFSRLAGRHHHFRKHIVSILRAEVRFSVVLPPHRDSLYEILSSYGSEDWSSWL